MVMVNPERLQKGRERAALTQVQAADAMGVPRALISMWENGRRMPSDDQVASMAHLYDINEAYLRGDQELDEGRKRRVLYRHISEGGRLQGNGSTREVERWMRFLDNWAAFTTRTDEDNDSLRPGKPPRELDEGGNITDARRASKLATKVRNYYGLGQDAIPDLYSFLDEIGVLVYKTKVLEPVSRLRQTVSGAFYNHPGVGFSILVNVNCSEGRQAFTLAHEFAHALYHYREQALVSLSQDDQPRERFANAFAAYFLVPAQKLRALAKRERSRTGSLSPYSAVRFAAYFRVSYLMMLFRMYEERLITRDQVEEWRGYSPVGMARNIGLNPDFLMSPDQQEGGLGTDSIEQYPSSVIDRIHSALVSGRIDTSEAIDLLQLEISEEELRTKILDFPLRGEGEAENFDEYPVRWRE